MLEPWTPTAWDRRSRTPSLPSPAESPFPSATPYPVASASPVLSERALNNSEPRTLRKRIKNQEEIRAVLRGLSAAERSQRLRELMMTGGTVSGTLAAPLKTFHDGDQLGCKHYARAALASAPCCSRFFTCRFCHDEASNHELNRKDVNRLKCMRCGHEQGVADKCEACHERFARYFCAECRFFDDTPAKDIFHCAECGLCRVGKREDYFHCKSCNACMALSLKGKHKCVERCLESGCPVCTEFMFTSTAPITFFECGHSMHTSCFDEYRKTNYVCPICSKSLGDMGDFVAKVDEVMRHARMPAVFTGVKAKIFCADCEKRSTVAFHFVYHKCAECGSYNTKLLERFRD